MVEHDQHKVLKMKLISSLALLGSILADNYDYDEFGNKKNKGKKPNKGIERDNSLLDGNKIKTGQDSIDACNAIDYTVRQSKSAKKEKRPVWEKIVGGWEVNIK